MIMKNRQILLGLRLHSWLFCQIRTQATPFLAFGKDNSTFALLKCLSHIKYSNLHGIAFKGEYFSHQPD